MQRREQERSRSFEARADADPLHLVMAVTGEPPVETVQTLQGLQGQTTGRWMLTAVVHDSWHNDFTALLAVSGIQRSGQRVRVLTAGDGSGPAEMTTLGLAAASGFDVALIFPGDLWAPDTVAQLGHALAPDRVVYADEDRLDAGGSHVAPRLKPAYSPDFLLASPYVGRPLAMGSALVSGLQARGSSTAEEIEHDLALQVCEGATRVIHLPEVLCHRVGGAIESPASDSDLHVVAALARRGDAATVRPGPAVGTFRLLRDAPSTCTVSIIIPFRDEPRFLRTCVDSIDATKGAQPTEYVLVDNGSVLPETATLLDQLGGRPDVRVLSDRRPFNWAELNNVAADTASGDVLVFLNNDIEATSVGWLAVLCAQALRADVGAVGARLLYPDRRLQHCGVVIGLGGAAGHLFVGLEEAKSGYLGMAVVARECAAVTGACLATRRDVFASLEGFDASLGVDLNDVDYCLRAQRDGLRVIFDPTVELIHHESPSRGTAGDTRDIVHFIDRWSDSILSGDPYLNPHLTRVDSSCALRGPDEKEWWQRWRSSLG
ncbi:MAG TPA: glycosyltransferase family 2 protein [Acidimicrobiales bacterium]